MNVLAGLLDLLGVRRDRLKAEEGVSSLFQPEDWEQAAECH